MPITRTNARNRAHQYADALGSQRWTDAEVNVLLGERQHFWIRQLLDTNPYHYVNQSVVNTSSDGGIPLLATTGTDDTLQTSYKTIGILRDNIPLQEVKFSDYKTAAIYGADMRMYYQLGDKWIVLPVQNNYPITHIWNYLPQRVDLLATDASNIPFPDGYEDVFILDTAVHMLMKAGSETNASVGLNSFLAGKVNDFLTSVGRRGTNPYQWKYSDDGLSWGSN